MNEMIERVARALCREDRPLSEPDDLVVERGCKSWEQYTGAARLAIEAMRDPTAKMLKVMEPWTKASGHQDLVWRAGIDEALR